jgi:hypothetical protein
MARDLTDRDIVSSCVVHGLSASGVGIGIDSPDAIVSALLSGGVPTRGCRIREPTFQLLMPESHGCPFDSDSDPDPEAYDVHAGSG